MEKKYVLISAEYLEKFEHNYEEILSQIRQLNHKVDAFVYSDGVIGTREAAADFIGYKAQTIDTLIREGRIINYGRGKIFIFHKNELMDLRNTRESNNA